MAKEEEAKERLAETGNKVQEAESAIRHAAENYMEKSPVKFDLSEVERFADARPLTFVGIGAAAGFLVGGGLQTKLGLTLLALFGRRAAKQTAVNFTSGWMRNQSPSRSIRHRPRFMSAMRAR